MDWLKRDAQVFPELLLFPTDEQARLAWKGARVHVYMRVRFWTYVVVVIVIIISCKEAMPRTGKGLDWIISTALAMLAAFACGGGALFVFRRGARNSLRIALLEAGIPVCLRCGYCLRGTDAKRCPECGADRSTMESL